MSAPDQIIRRHFRGGEVVDVDGREFPVRIFGNVNQADAVFPCENRGFFAERVTGGKDNHVFDLVFHDFRKRLFEFGIRIKFNVKPTLHSFTHDACELHCAVFVVGKDDADGFGNARADGRGQLVAVVSEFIRDPPDPLPGFLAEAKGFRMVSQGPGNGSNVHFCQFRNVFDRDRHDLFSSVF
ncbi:hypothetical protein SDC9_200758 [bioreactor metagenome]|uniref:Uncharacterized protein n=1 Tax=bioreactor metagenome TaxID=1076179 RepID=A0A645IXJ1_9ZZZZ